MRYVFVDTAHYIAVFNRHDALHARASSIVLELYANPDVSFITTDAVLVEAPRSSRAVDRTRGRRSPTVLRTCSLIPASSSSHRHQRYSMPALSFTGGGPTRATACATALSMVVCAERGITDVLSADRDFEQEGLTLLL